MHPLKKNSSTTPEDLGTFLMDEVKEPLEVSLKIMYNVGISSKEFTRMSMGIGLRRFSDDE